MKERHATKDCAGHRGRLRCHDHSSMF